MSLKFLAYFQESVVMYQEHAVSRHGMARPDVPAESPEFLKCGEPGCSFKTLSMGANFH